MSHRNTPAVNIKHLHHALPAPLSPHKGTAAGSDRHRSAWTRSFSGVLIWPSGYQTPRPADAGDVMPTQLSRIFLIHISQRGRGWGVKTTKQVGIC